MKITIMATIQDKSDPSPEEFDKMTRSRVWVVLVNILQILNHVQVDCSLWLCWKKYLLEVGCRCMTRQERWVELYCGQATRLTVIREE